MQELTAEAINFKLRLTFIPHCAHTLSLVRRSTIRSWHPGLLQRKAASAPYNARTATPVVQARTRGIILIDLSHIAFVKYVTHSKVLALQTPHPNSVTAVPHISTAKPDHTEAGTLQEARYTTRPLTIGLQCVTSFSCSSRSCYNMCIWPCMSSKHNLVRYVRTGSSITPRGRG